MSDMPLTSPRIELWAAAGHMPSSNVYYSTCNDVRLDGSMTLHMVIMFISGTAINKASLR